MTFSDDDLKRLKESLVDGDEMYEAVLDHGMVQGLIARLEAAELCASQFSASFPDHAITKAWREAKGIDTESLQEWDRRQRRAAGK